MKKAIMRISDTLDRYVGYTCGILLGLMTLSVLAGVLFRYVFRSPIGWTEEISRYLMIWAASLAVSIGVKNNEHIGITVLVDAIKNKFMKIVVLVFIDIMVLIFLVVMVIFSINMVDNARFQMMQSFQRSMFLPVISIPIAMGLSILQLVFKFLAGAHGDTEHAVAQSNLDI